MPAVLALLSFSGFLRRPFGLILDFGEIRYSRGRAAPPASKAWKTAHSEVIHSVERRAFRMLIQSWLADR